MYNVHGLFPIHLSATQIHSQVQVHNKQMSSTGLVYVCVCVCVCVCVFLYFFAIALFCLIKYNLSTSEVRSPSFDTFLFLEALPFQGAAWMICLPDGSLFSVLSSQSVFL
uniref:Uncharacterized protein n=1 Tax=Mus musculus TaxID=10090 RepID=Q8C7P2_MOUSE|nr:unnamed protein product [Mus musculus]BAE23803.1 unnamed protein product [Mus musculus]